MNENRKAMKLIHELKSDLSIIELNIKEAPNLKKSALSKGVECGSRNGYRFRCFARNIT